MDRGTADLLVCPLCHGPFDWTEVTRVRSEIEEARLRCPACGIRASVRAGIGYFLPGDAPAGPPDVRPHGPTPDLVPDRTGATDPPGWFLTAGPPVDWLTEGWEPGEGPVLEIGPGTGAIPGRLDRPGLRRSIVVEGDESAHRDRQVGRAGRPSGDPLVADAHSLPFADRSVPVALSEFGLQNLPGTLVILRELRRVVAGELRAVAAFLTEPTGPNFDWLRSAGLLDAYDERRCLETFRRARWEVTFTPKVETMVAPAAGGSPDEFPVVPARVRLGLLSAR